MPKRLTQSPPLLVLVPLVPDVPDVPLVPLVPLVPELDLPLVPVPVVHRKLRHGGVQH
jgi:hypothetical protein